MDRRQSRGRNQGVKMFAIISHNGNQYQVSPDKVYSIDLIESDEKDKKIVFSDVLLFSDDKKVLVGEPTLRNVNVEAEILGTVRGEKLTATKFHAKKRYKRNLGHRQSYTSIKVLKINLTNEK